MIDPDTLDRFLIGLALGVVWTCIAIAVRELWPVARTLVGVGL